MSGGGFEEEAEETVSINEYIQNMEDEELEADLVLGGDEGDECTYAKGYMKRQAIFSCLTCTPEGNAGVCTACCLSCHDGHEIPRDEEGEPLYEDFICNVCSPVCSFLMSYPETIWATGGQCVALTDAGKDKNVLEDIPSSCGSGKLEDGVCTPSSPGKDKGITNANPESTSCGSKSVIGESSEEKISSNDHPYVSCVLGVNKVPASPDSESKPFFLSKNWRDVLCRCEKCLNMYNQKHISYLLDKEDTIAEYEKRAKQKRVEKLQQQEGDALSFFNNLGHVTKMEILNGIQDFTEEFRGFLGSVDPSKTVTAADIHQLFENLKNKRRRM